MSSQEKSDSSPSPEVKPVATIAKKKKTSNKKPPPFRKSKEGTLDKDGILTRSWVLMSKNLPENNAVYVPVHNAEPFEHDENGKPQPTWENLTWCVKIGGEKNAPKFLSFVDLDNDGNLKKPTISLLQAIYGKKIDPEKLEATVQIKKHQVPVYDPRFVHQKAQLKKKREEKKKENAKKKGKKPGIKWGKKKRDRDQADNSSSSSSSEEEEKTQPPKKKTKTEKKKSSSKKTADIKKKKKKRKIEKEPKTPQKKIVKPPTKPPGPPKKRKKFGGIKASSVPRNASKDDSSSSSSQ